MKNIKINHNCTWACILNRLMTSYKPESKGIIFGKYLKKEIKIILIKYLKVFKMNFISPLNMIYYWQLILDTDFTDMQQK